MKLLYLALPLLGSLVVAQTLQDADDCQCPMVKCPPSDTYAGCRCTNLAELRCQGRCPKYVPTGLKSCGLPKQTNTSLRTPTLPLILLPTPVLPTPVLPTSVLPIPVSPTSDLPTSVNISSYLINAPVNEACKCWYPPCPTTWPDSCYCENANTIGCWRFCGNGGDLPLLNTCPNPEESRERMKRVAAPKPQSQPSKVPVSIPVAVPTVPAAVATASAVPSVSSGTAKANSAKECVCESVFCIQSWPESCVCSNAAKHKCWKKCGGVKPAMQLCAPRPSAIVKPPKPTSTSTSKPAPTSGLHQVQTCGGLSMNSTSCPSGYTCINDPYKSGCGLECDGTGICVQEKMCGGFAGFKCDGDGQVCVDDPRDDCSPQNGGADCGGLCVWPPSLRAT